MAISAVKIPVGNVLDPMNGILSRVRDIGFDIQGLQTPIGQERLGLPLLGTC